MGSRVVQGRAAGATGAGVGSQGPCERVGSRLNGNDTCRSSLQKTIGKAAGRRADIDADCSRGVDLKRFQRRLELQSAAADVSRFGGQRAKVERRCGPCASAILAWLSRRWTMRRLRATSMRRSAAGVPRPPRRPAAPGRECEAQADAPTHHADTLRLVMPVRTRLRQLHRADQRPGAGRGRQSPGLAAQTFQVQ